MVCIPKTPSKSLSHALLKAKLGREQFEQFKAKLSGLVEQISSSPNESEEHHKNHISDFLKYAFKFPAYFINTSERIDLVIHNGKSSTDSVGVTPKEIAIVEGGDGQGLSVPGIEANGEAE